MQRKVGAFARYCAVNGSIGAAFPIGLEFPYSMYAMESLNASADAHVKVKLFFFLSTSHKRSCHAACLLLFLPQASLAYGTETFGGGKLRHLAASISQCKMYQANWVSSDESSQVGAFLSKVLAISTNPIRYLPWLHPFR
ncbi:hypothetical protein TWF225_008819 [Orbilia oligospora]|uniref:Uncharacterized protein n=1 Tax=Orbilia oligospora TaxID=2813651 RepID=A0A7C8U5L1_ORBOL|nr:hypothetical protein TWF225_008819 [Orbilia oligospora]KAF3181364.1 hypothetical protein TWF751_009313 [Orbilia oligospora]KAF3254622.1 hypothetical protein TWF217_006837 [Orbilia oligospora]KAF3259228.1 hypothetical protein TWF128_004314 [Orbilia oligospora]KAF3282535.1 hypothetical protein TWF132_010667 [Orbilia oligospora]